MTISTCYRGPFCLIAVLDGTGLSEPLSQQMGIDKALAASKTNLCAQPFSPPEAFIHEINLFGNPLSNLTCGKHSFQAGRKNTGLKTSWRLADMRGKGFQ